MRALPLFALPLVVGCVQENSFVALVEPADSPSVVLEATYPDIGYEQTDGTCFQVPASGRGTGYASRPDLALGTIWLRDRVCPEGEECAWAPTLEIYGGPSRIEDSVPVEQFNGFTFFDDSEATGILAELFAAQIAPGALAEVTASRAYEGLVDYSQLDTQRWLEEWQAVHDIEVFEHAGFAWNVHLYEWQAQFYDRVDAVTDENEAIRVAGSLYEPTLRRLTGYEVFVCVVDLL